ncbi:MAG: ABC transporter permease [Acidimicrobiales bacterium]|jgi:ABC-2 type transport system permease protein|nr:ABC transporter permease [Acidimicrobiales bacterium]HLV91384.1 ABC transporter permease [Acidimicrobiia bacterium]
MTTTTFEPWVRKRPAWAVIASKEFSDHLLSVRFVALLAIMGMVALATVYTAAVELRDVAPQTVGEPGLFLRLFTVASDTLRLSFLQFIGLLAPILGIAYGFDAVNGERSQGTLPRLVSQPIHRDDVINGKFVAGLGVVGLTVVIVAFLVAGLGIFLLGVVPGPGEIIRLIAWTLAAIAYIGVWLAFATLCSVMTRRAATSAIVSIGVWLLLAIFGSMIFELLAGVISPVIAGDPFSEAANLRTQIALSRISPITLYQEASTVLLSPGVRTVGLVTLEQLDRAILSRLSFGQSVLLVWPQLVGMVAATVVIFAFAYIRFMRQEVRA